MHLATSPNAARHALPQLFARYVAGQIADTQWMQLADILDEADALPEERAAFARFYLDLLVNPVDGEVKLPSTSEMKDLLGVVRA